ncbi:ABC transporter ATP-binding protein YtrB [Rosistilla carotiformis]|uniref:ABC transporter ATP-binding protein YtrB n=1 Tax=Rosistilla carotiformis TaxID=2528017 RepID=A0A518JRK8_9BACT|nr:ABC transporter ATP-binding protein [Rosistilla carotiformis]QDV68166.1 ABC transporter ATP-binding protein YtrB [Rosistilla carotiformis]
MNPVIETQRLTMRFRGCDALTDVNLRVEPGTVFALLGENGAGKTTMIRILAGYQKPTSGSATVCGVDPGSDPLGVRRQIGYVSDAPALYDWMTVAEIGWFAASFYDVPFLDPYLESVRRYGLPEDRKIKHLSKGQRAKVALSLSLAHAPQLLILDEPTSGLDPMVRREFLESMIDLAATGRTVFLSSHQISEVERVADTIAIVHQGRLRLCKPLAELKDSVTEIVVALDDPLVGLPALPSPAELLTEESFGRQRRMVVQDLPASALPLLREATGVLDVQQRQLTLEEIFIAATKGSLGPIADHAVTREEVL